MSALSSLLGGSATNSLAAAIGKFSGVGDGKASTLIGLITPLIMNGLKNQAGGLDAGRISNLLLSQKDNIAAALPAGVANLLGDSGILSGVPNGNCHHRNAGNPNSGYAASFTDQLAALGYRSACLAGRDLVVFRLSTKSESRATAHHDD